MRKALCSILSIILLSALLSNTASADTSTTSNTKDKIMNSMIFYNNIVANEVKYIKNLMMSNGAIPMYAASISEEFVGKNLPDVNGFSADVYTKWRVGKVIPYFSQSAVLGLLKSAPDKSKETVAKFITWYLDSINDSTSDAYGVDGTIYDLYVFQNPINPEQVLQLPARVVRADEFETPQENNIDYDSTDSYAALLLRILSEYYHIYDDTSVFVNRKAEVDRVLNALFATYIDKIDLTYAKPSYEVCYLMDNCEVYNGLLAAAEIYDKVYKDSEKAKELSDYAVKVKDAIEKYMWNEKEQVYYSAVFKDGKPAFKMDWTVFYPHATAQLFPILFGLIEPDSDRAVMLYEKFNDNFGLVGAAGKDWTALDKGDNFPWCTLAHVAGIVGDYERLDRFMTYLERKHLKTHAGPYYYCGEAGQALLAVSYMQKPKYIIGIDKENITAKVGEAINLGVNLIPSTALPGKLNVKIKDSTIATFDSTTGKINAIAIGQTVITISSDSSTKNNKNEFIIILNVVGSGSETSTGESTAIKPGGKPDILTTVIIGSLVVIGGSITLGYFLLKNKKSKKAK